jgi:hypothetical protein
LFNDLQEELIQTLITNKRALTHSTTQGDENELQWVKTLRNFLPRRYKVKKAFVVDFLGNISEQIDVVIFDRQYSPFIFKRNNAVYVPAESVYAVFEIKPEFTVAHFEYAQKKAASVRCLQRTSLPIPNTFGIATSKPLHEILAGLLTRTSENNIPITEKLLSKLERCEPNRRLQLGCILNYGSFDIDYDGSIRVKTSQKEYSLISFLSVLYKKLQVIGTAPMLDIQQYTKWIGYKAFYSQNEKTNPLGASRPTTTTRSRQGVRSYDCFQY